MNPLRRIRRRKTTLRERWQHRVSLEALEKREMLTGDSSVSAQSEVFKISGGDGADIFDLASWRARGTDFVHVSLKPDAVVENEVYRLVVEPEDQAGADGSFHV